jgi:hypothetical protein
MSLIQLFIVSFVVICCAGCDSGIDKSFIPGTYIQYSQLHLDEDSYTRIHDTIEIESSGKTGKEAYRIIRRYTTFKTVDGKALQPEHKTRRWTGTFWQNSQTLFVNESGKLISFYPEANSIMLGSVAYKKLQ